MLLTDIISLVITVDKALSIVLKNALEFGREEQPLDSALGRVLAKDIVADRDIPPYNRSTMDGIAVRYYNLRKTKNFKIKVIQAAGDTPKTSFKDGECAQIMTGAAVPNDLDTIIPVEQLAINSNLATVNADFSNLKKGQFIHLQGKDASAGKALVKAGSLIVPSVIPIATSAGLSKLVTAKAPRIIAISTGDELVKIDQKPSLYQIRQSNNYAVKAVLAPYRVDLLHISDDKQEIKNKLRKLLLDYDLVILSGGVSKGEFDYIPDILKELSVSIHFHGVAQKPGKPLLFGIKGKKTIFGLPGNPVSTFMCLHAYVKPWLDKSLGLNTSTSLKCASLARDVTFKPNLNYFLQVSLSTDNSGKLIARPLDHNGSGDYLSVANADAFIELPAGKDLYKAGESYKIIALRSIM